MGGGGGGGGCLASRGIVPGSLQDQIVQAALQLAKNPVVGLEDLQDLRMAAQEPPARQANALRGGAGAAGNMRGGMGGKPVANPDVEQAKQLCSAVNLQGRPL